MGLLQNGEIQIDTGIQRSTKDAVRYRLDKGEIQAEYPKNTLQTRRGRGEPGGYGKGDCVRGAINNRAPHVLGLSSDLVNRLVIRIANSKYRKLVLCD